jgi:CheY-like chemotaxis protein
MAGKKILIVEDEVVQLTALARRPKTAGFEIVAARDGLTAISTARKEVPDLILLDLGLPAGDGFVVLQRLGMLINTGTIPIIVVSSRTPSAIAMRLSKPEQSPTSTNLSTYPFCSKPSTTPSASPRLIPRRHHRRLPCLLQTHPKSASTAPIRLRSQPLFTSFAPEAHAAC